MNQYTYIPELDMNVNENSSVLFGFELTEEVLGEGSYGKVIAVRKVGEVESNYVFKLIRKSEVVKASDMEMLNNEIRIMSKLNDEQAPKFVCAKQTEHFYILISERSGKSLSEFWESNGASVSRNKCNELMSSMMSVLASVHSSGVAHRDIKPSNMLMNESSDRLEVRLCDFGLSSDSKAMVSDFCGSPGFFAPETVGEEAYDAMKADMFSLGCTMLYLMVGEERFKRVWKRAYSVSRNMSSLCRALSQAKEELLGWVQQQDGEWENEYVPLVSKLLSLDANARPSADCLLSGERVSECFESRSTTMDECMDSMGMLELSTANGSRSNSSSRIVELPSLSNNSNVDLSKFPRLAAKLQSVVSSMAPSSPEACAPRRVPSPRTQRLAAIHA